jgi:phage recombination protein Bet
MTAPAAQQQPPAQGMTKSDFELLLEKDVKGSTWVQPFGAEDDYQVPLNRTLIRKYIAEPAVDRQTKEIILPSDEECDKFTALCKARRLNPYEGDAYMIPYWDGKLGRHRWSLITAHAAFLKRAELHFEYNGMESGIIVQRGEQILELVGDFRLDTDKLLGGWSRVHKKGKDYPMEKKVKLTTYIKEFGVWLKDPEGMICKVAEAQNLRDSFPTIIGGLYLKEEMDAHEEFQRLVNQEPVKRPELGCTPDNMTTAPAVTVVQPASTAPLTEQQVDKAKGRGKRDSKGRPTMVEEPLEKQPEPPAQQTAPPAQQSTPPVQQQTPPAQQSSQAPPQASSPPVVSQPAPAPTSEAPASDKPEETILRLCNAQSIGMQALINYLRKDKWMNSEQKQITEMSIKKLEAIAKAFTADPVKFVERIKAAQPK